jgi:endonuclease-3
VAKADTLGQTTGGWPRRVAGALAAETLTARRQRAATIAERLAERCPGADCSLRFFDPFQLRITTILSAQCTEKRGNLVTPGLFEKWQPPAKLAAASLEQIEKIFQSTGFFRAKAKDIKGC